jgi:gas vesicle protein
VSALSDFLSNGTAPWWGAPVGAILGGVAGQLVAARTSRQSDERKMQEERARFQAENANASRNERLAYARTVGVNLISQADELAEALASIHKQLSTLYTGFKDGSMNQEKFDNIIDPETRAAGVMRDSSTKRLDSLRAELEILAPDDVVRAAIALIAAATGTCRPRPMRLP